MTAALGILALASTLVACGRDAPPGRTAIKSLPPTMPTTTTPPPPVPEDPIVAFGLKPWSTAVAYAQVPTISVYPAPDAPAASMTFANPNNLGAPLVFRVTKVFGRDWLQVMLPVRPNESTGWVRSADVKLYNDDYQVVVHLATHTLVLMKDGQQIETHPIISGMPSAPTPTGDFYATELLKAPYPNGPYGPYAFGLSGFSDTYSEFEGGPGQIAMHGTNQPYLMGKSASHGCVRLTDDVIAHLAGVLPVGSPVLIEA